MNDIVARAGTTKPMIYYHFAGKEGLFAAVLVWLKPQTRFSNVGSATTTLLSPSDTLGIAALLGPKELTPVFGNRRATRVRRISRRSPATA